MKIRAQVHCNKCHRQNLTCVLAHDSMKDRVATLRIVSAICLAGSVSRLDCPLLNHNTCLNVLFKSSFFKIKLSVSDRLLFYKQIPNAFAVFKTVFVGICGANQHCTQALDQYETLVSYLYLHVHVSHA